MHAFTESVIRIIREIPPGKVMTYGQVAAHAGSPRAARQVARLLHSMSAKHNLPWHRVVNAAGKISLMDESHRKMQEELLKREGVELTMAKLDLTRHRHDPGADAF